MKVKEIKKLLEKLNEEHEVVFCLSIEDDRGSITSGTTHALEVDNSIGNGVLIYLTASEDKEP